MATSQSANASPRERELRRESCGLTPRIERVVRSIGLRSTAVFLLPIASGWTLARAFPPINWNGAVWFGLIPFCIAVASKRPVSAYLGSYVGGFTFYLIGLDWIRTAYGGAGFSGPWALPWIVVAQCMAPSWLLAMWLARFVYYRLHWSMSLSFAVAWIGAEFVGQATSLLLSGTEFQWLELAATQVELAWLIQVADFGGAALVTMIIAFFNGAIFDAVSSKGHFKHAVSALAVFIVVATYGFWRLGQSPSGATLAVCLLPHDAFLDPSSAVPDAIKGADVLLWPESAFGRREAGLEQSTLQELERLAAWSDAWLVAGLLRRVDGKMRNSVAIISPENGFEGYYDKACPVPWGEFTPRIFRIFGRAAGDDIVAGNTFPTFVCSAGRIAPLICNDVCFSRTLRRYEQPDVFLVASCEEADATGALQASMEQIVRLRAIELRKPIVTSSQGGYSGAVSANGRILCRIDDTIRAPRRQTVVRMDPIPLDNQFAPYSIYGDWPMLCGLCTAIIIGIVRMLHGLPSAPKALTHIVRRISLRRPVRHVCVGGSVVSLFKFSSNY